MMHLMTWTIRDVNSESVKSPSPVNRTHNSHVTVSGHQKHIKGKKVKQSRNRPGVVQRVAGDSGSQIS